MKLALLVAAALAGSLAPLSQKGGQAVVTGQEVRYDYPKRQVTLTGAPVRLTRGDAVLTCRRLVADQDAAGQIVRATCTGDVRLVRGPRTVTCETATYEDAAARVTCEGAPVVLRDGATEARGERLVYDLSTDVATLGKGSGAASGGGVTITAPGEDVDARRKQVGAQRRAKGAKP